mgnify:CR=1 FL=1
MVEEEKLRELMVKLAEELEEKPLAQLSKAEIRAIMSCRVSDDIKDRALCYKGFFEGLKYKEEIFY